MKYSTFFTAAAVASVASAHATLWEAVVDGVSGGSDGRGTYIRAPKDNSPLKDITSNNLRCNVGGGSAVAKTLDAKPGSTIDLEWHHDTDSAADDTIAESHKGPVITYIAPAASNGEGNVWVKIAEDGYSGGKWAVDKLKAASGKHTIKLPANLANGEYLLRDEIIALHESDTAFSSNSARGAQLYMGCVQLKVTGAGTTTLPAGVAFPGAYSYSDAGIVYNLYGADPTTYKIPGPAVYNGAGGAAPAAPVASSSAAPVPTTLQTSTRPATVPTQAPPAQSSAAPVTTTGAPAAPVVTSAAPVKPSSTKKACPVKPTSAPVAPPASGVAAKWAQCGGIGYSGVTACASGTSCQKQNDWYYQCL